MADNSEKTAHVMRIVAEQVKNGDPRNWGRTRMTAKSLRNNFGIKAMTDRMRHDRLLVKVRLYRIDNEWWLFSTPDEVRIVHLLDKGVYSRVLGWSEYSMQLNPVAIGPNTVRVLDDSSNTENWYVPQYLPPDAMEWLKEYTDQTRDDDPIPTDSHVSLRLIAPKMCRSLMKSLKDSAFKWIDAGFEIDVTEAKRFIRELIEDYQRPTRNRRYNSLFEAFNLPAIVKDFGNDPQNWILENYHGIAYRYLNVVTAVGFGLVKPVLVGAYTTSRSYWGKQRWPLKTRNNRNTT